MTHPLLFVHGAWHSSWCWTEHLTGWFTERGHQVGTVDLRGHGSAPPKGSFKRTRLRDYVEDVAEAAAAFETPPVVVGHSMGGLVVQKYLERHTAPGGVLVASVPPRGVIGVTLDVAKRHPLTFARMNATWSLLPAVADREEAADLFYGDRLDRATALDYAGRVQEEAYFAFLDMLVLDRAKPDRVSAPVLVIGAEHDRVFPPKDSHALAAAYGTEAVMLDAGHNLMLEPAWEDAALAIERWVADR